MNRNNPLIKSQPLLRESVKFFLILFLPIALLFQGCESRLNPIVPIKKELEGKKEYAIILNDMREDGNFFPSYYHQYRVDVEEQKTVRSFVEVEKSYYKKNEPYLGMVLVSKTADGTVSTTPFPNGYQYVGNPQYGRWRDSGSGGSMWEFYGKYMLMSQVMGWAGFGLNRNHYNSYASNYSSGRPYYGPNREYGTAGTVTKKQKPGFYQRRMAKQSRSKTRFQNKIGQRTGRSKNTYRSRGFGFGK